MYQLPVDRYTVPKITFFHKVTIFFFDYIAVNKHYELLETLAEDIFFELFKNTNIQKIVLKIEKTQIIKNTSSVGIEITKKRL